MLEKHLPPLNVNILNHRSQTLPSSPRRIHNLFREVRNSERDIDILLNKRETEHLIMSSFVVSVDRSAWAGGREVVDGYPD